MSSLIPDESCPPLTWVTARMSDVGLGRGEYSTPSSVIYPLNAVMLDKRIEVPSERGLDQTVLFLCGAQASLLQVGNLQAVPDIEDEAFLLSVRK